MFQDCRDAIRSAVLEAVGAQQTIDAYAMAHKLNAAYPQVSECEVAQIIGKIVAEVPGACALWEPSNTDRTP